jgi:dTMP kinase
MNKRGILITFEGIEGCGKSTQVKLLTRRLKECRMPVLATLEPGGSSIGQSIRKILLDSRNTGLSPLAELLLYEADRAQHVREVIRPALKKGLWVLCDRFSDATEAYQGRARGEPISLVRELNRVATGGLKPDVTFLLDLPVEVGLARARRRNLDTNAGDQDRFEREELSFHEKVREAYLLLARREKKRFVVIQAQAGEKEVEESIFRSIEPLIHRTRRRHCHEE